MAAKIFKILAASIALGAVLCFGTDLTLARSGGGHVGGGGGGGHIWRRGRPFRRRRSKLQWCAVSQPGIRRTSFAAGRIMVRSFAALASADVTQCVAAHASAARRFAALASAAHSCAALTSVARSCVALASVALARWPVGPLGTSGAIIIITGGPGGTADGADGDDLLALLLRRPFRLHALALRLLRSVLGLWRYFRLGCHVLARSRLRLRPRPTMYMETMHMAALHDHAPREPAMSTAKPQARQPQPTATIWRRPAAGWRRA